MNEEELKIPEIKLEPTGPEVMQEVKVEPAFPIEPKIEVSPVAEPKNEVGAVNLKRFAVKRFKLPKFDFSRLHGGQKTKMFAGILAGLLLLLVVLGLAIGIPGIAVYNKAKVLMADQGVVKAAVAKQDIAQIKTAVAKVKTDLISFEGTYNILAWTRFMPILGPYWSDGNAAIKGGLSGIDAANIGIDTATPYADIIGFAGNGANKAKSGEQSANDRVDFIAKTIKDVIPKVGELSTKAQEAKSHSKTHT